VPEPVASSSDSGRKIWVNYEDCWTKITLGPDVNDIDDLRQQINRDLKLDVFPSRILLRTHDGKNLDQEDAPVPSGFASKATALSITLKPEKKSNESTKPQKKEEKKKENDEAKETPGEDIKDVKDVKEIKALNSIGVSFDEKSEKYKVLDNEGKEKVTVLLAQIKDLRGILERKRSERAPVQAAKEDALKKIRQIFEKLKEEKKKLPNRLQPLPQLRENDEKAFNVREEKGKEKEKKQEVKEEAPADAESLTKQRTELDELKKLVSTVSAEAYAVVNSEEKLKAEKKKREKEAIRRQVKGGSKKESDEFGTIRKVKRKLSS